MILLFVSQSASHGGAPFSQVKTWAMAHKGKATSAVDFNPEDPLGVQQSLHPQPSHRVHNGGQGGPWAGVRSEHPGFRRRPCHEGGRRQEAWQVLAWRQRRRHGHYSHSLPDPSKRHGPEAAHTPTADQYTARHADFAGYYSFIRRSLFLTYL